jgi:hypothetical protein
MATINRMFLADGRIPFDCHGRGAGLRARDRDVEPGLSVAEIDATELEPPTTGSDVDRIRAVTQDYRVSVPVAVKATLTKAK